MGRDFKKIKAWQLADQLVLSIYQFTKTYPNEEKYGIVSQLRRAAVSIPTNIAEGSARGSKKDYLRFLYIAKGSLAEIEYLVHVSKNLKYLNESNYGSVESARIECIKTLQGLINFIENETTSDKVNLEGLKSIV